MKILHSYLKAAIFRRINAIVFRVELKKIARLTKKIESISKYIKKAKKSNSIENIRQHRYQFYDRFDRSDSDAPQDAVQGNDRKDDRDKDDYRERDRNREDRFDNDTNWSQVECWNCDIRDHYRANCRKSLQNDSINNDSKKAQGQST